MAFDLDVYKLLQCVHINSQATIMETSTLTLRLDNTIKERLEKLAEVTHRTKSYLASEAIARYVENEAWQIEEIQLALVEADRGDFASTEEVTGLMNKYAG